MFSIIGEYPESTILFLLAGASLFQAWWLKKDFFSPINVYFFCQCLTLGIAYMRLDVAMTDFHTKTWLVWIGALLSFSCGSILYQCVNPPPNSCSKKECVNYDWKKHFIFSCCVLGLYLIGIFGLLQKVGNLIVFTDEPAKWTSVDMDYGCYSSFFSSAPLVILFFGVASFKSINPLKVYRNISRFVVVTVTVLNVLAYPSRTTFFMCIGFFLLFFNYLKKKISVLWILLVLTIGIAVFVSIASIRSQYGMGSVENMALDAVVSMPYKYVANNYWNLDYVLNPLPDQMLHPYTYGMDFFAGMLEYSHIPGALRNSFGWDGIFNQSVMKVYGYNTTGYLWEVYKDFDMPGIFIFPFICGLAMSALYRHLKCAFTPRTLIFYTFFIYFIGFWFFLAGYKQGIYWVWGLLIYFFTTLCQKRRAVGDDSNSCA